MEDQGDVHYCLGMPIKRNRRLGTLMIDQKAYLDSVLRRFGMADSKTVSTPMEAGKSFEKLKDDDDPVNLREYQAAFGCLMYASIGTRPDLSSSVGVLSRFMTKPGNEHWRGVKRVLRYIQRTLNYSLKFQSTKTSVVNLNDFANPDWTGNVDTRKSTSGYLFQIGSSIVSWSSKRQTMVALSTTEAEYVALSYATQETIWLRKLLEIIGFKQPISTTINEDNQSTISLVKNPKQQNARNTSISSIITFGRLSRETALMFSIAVPKT